MKRTNNKKEVEFLKLFDQKQHADEKLKNYILSKNPIIGEKKLKDLLKKSREISTIFYSFLAKR